MQLLLADLFCNKCRAYVHPFLDACPGCGATRQSHYAEALGDDATGPSLVDDPALARASAEASTKFALGRLRTGVMGVLDSEGAGLFGGIGQTQSASPLGELVDQVTSQLTHRCAGLASTPMDADIRVESGSLSFRDQKRTEVAAIDPALVLALVPVEAHTDRRLGYIGLEAVAPLPAPPVGGDRLIVVWRAPEGHRQIVIGNRTGFFAAHARLEHYLDLTTWLGVLSAASAQSRWRSIGARAHAAEIGLRPGPATR